VKHSEATYLGSGVIEWGWSCYERMIGLAMMNCPAWSLRFTLAMTGIGPWICRQTTMQDTQKGEVFAVFFSTT